MAGGAGSRELTQGAVHESRGNVSYTQDMEEASTAAALAQWWKCLLQGFVSMQDTHLNLGRVDSGIYFSKAITPEGALPLCEHGGWRATGVTRTRHPNT